MSGKMGYGAPSFVMMTCPIIELVGMKFWLMDMICGY